MQRSKGISHARAFDGLEHNSQEVETFYLILSELSWIRRSF